MFKPLQLVTAAARGLHIQPTGCSPSPSPRTLRPPEWIWRADFTALRYRLVDTPPEVEKGLRRYMDTLGLAYAAVDFAIDQDRFWFLESNSSGQYGWLEAQTGAPITAALADLLTSKQGDAP